MAYLIATSLGNTYVPNSLLENNYNEKTPLASDPVAGPMEAAPFCPRSIRPAPYEISGYTVHPPAAWRRTLVLHLAVMVRNGRQQISDCVIISGEEIDAGRELSVVFFLQMFVIVGTCRGVGWGDNPLLGRDVK
jgi:hypothetical protein